MNSIELAKKIRITSVEMVHRAHASHLAGALSMADILAVLYADVMHYDAKNPKEPSRDRMLLSKGHTCVALYAALAHNGFFPLDLLDTYGQDGSIVLCHVTDKLPGVEISSGSLGHGLPIACGIAYGAKVQKQDFRTYVILGDGEMDEGSNWEAFLFGAHHHLDNICAIIDYNKMQAMGNNCDILNLDPLKKKLEAFNWNAIEIDGNNHEQLHEAFRKASEMKGKPTVIIANTIKGKGISFMEHRLKWHYSSPNDEQFKEAMEELK